MDSVEKRRLTSLKNEEAINYYINYLRYNKKRLKERINQQYEYFKSIRNEPKKENFI